jgi:hypothetical protein
MKRFVPAIVAISAAVAAGSWGGVIAVPGLGAGEARVASLSCASAGSCVAGGVTSATTICGRVAGAGAC